MNEKEALNQSMKLCSRKEYASGEILKKLLEWEVDDDVAQKVISELVKEKFIDDNRYAHAFVNDKLKFSKWGKIKIAYMLRQKGVVDIVASEALNSIDQEQYEEILYLELKKKVKTIKTEDKYKAKGKLIQFASQRGFEYDVAARVADNIVNRNSNK